MPTIKDLVNFNEDDRIRLKQSFINASKNKKFQKLIETIPADEDLLMKYTSTLEDVAEEFDHCLQCAGLSDCKNKIVGYLTKPVVSGKTLVFECVACPYMKKKLKAESYLNNIELFQVSKSIREASIQNIQNDKERLKVIRYFKNFLDHYDSSEKPKGLYLNGNFGTGKTYLISALFNELAKRNVRSAIVYYPEFLRSLKESFDSDYKEKFQYVRCVGVLLLDDIGAEVVSSWGRDEILGSILQYRMEEGLPTFFTSNLTLEELEEHLALSNRGVEKVKARRIIERIRFMTEEMKLISKDRRNKKDPVGP